MIYQCNFWLGLATSIFLSQAVFAQAPKPDVVSGKAKYNQLCVTCHGVTGKGDGVVAAGLNPKPRNFQDTAYMSKKSDAVLKKVIQQGGAASGLSPIMPAWGSALNDQDIANVIAYVRGLGKGGAK